MNEFCIDHGFNIPIRMVWSVKLSPLYYEHIERWLLNYQNTVTPYQIEKHVIMNKEMVNNIMNARSLHELSHHSILHCPPPGVHNVIKTSTYFEMFPEYFNFQNADIYNLFKERFEYLKRKSVYYMIRKDKVFQTIEGISRPETFECIPPVPFNIVPDFEIMAQLHIRLCDELVEEYNSYFGANLTMHSLRKYINSVFISGDVTTFSCAAIVEEKSFSFKLAPEHILGVFETETRYLRGILTEFILNQTGNQNVGKRSGNNGRYKFAGFN